MKGPDLQSHYNEDIVTALQWMWGDGYLAPGGPEEVAELLHGISVVGGHVLDVGCGLGVIDVMLVDTYGAQSVVGIDVEPHLIEYARQRTADAGLNERVLFQLVEPGPLPFDENTFDMVFSKDAIVHIHDKSKFYTEVLRVLKPLGAFVASDWLCGEEETYTAQVEEYLELINLSYHMQSLEQTRQTIVEVGFERVVLKDRNEWYREEVKKELATLSGDSFMRLVGQVGQEHADYRLQVSSIKQQVIEQGFLRPAHMIGYKPSCLPG